MAERLLNRDSLDASIFASWSRHAFPAAFQIRVRNSRHSFKQDGNLVRSPATADHPFSLTAGMAVS